MIKIENAEIDQILKDFPESLVELIKDLLNEQNYTKKHDATGELVQKGKSIIPQLHKLVLSKNESLRKEVAKIIQLIADRTSIPLLINLLDDPVSDIRWIAAEGLIKIGKSCIVPLLKSVRDREKLTFLAKGAHHVLMSLLSHKEQEQLEALLASLDNYLRLGETAPVEASKALKTIFKKGYNK
jgi:HEAT repeat protein